MRESLFAALEHRVRAWDSLRMLDLYAGSGAVGLEAASRGAAEVVLVDQAPAAVRVLTANKEVVATAVSGRIEVVRARVERFVLAPGGPFDVVFADPPYSTPAAALADVLSALHGAGGIAQDAVVVVERSSRDDAWVWPVGLSADADRTYGEATLWYGRAAARGS